MRSYQLFDTISGNPLIVVDARGSQTRKVTGGGMGTHTIKLRDTARLIPRDIVASVLEPNAVTLVVRWGDFVEYAGLIIDSDYDRDGGSITVRSRELRTIWQHRMTFGVFNYFDGNLALTNRSHAGAVRAIVARGTQWGDIWSLPLDLPADGSGGFTADWKAYQCLLIEDLLQQVEKEGVEVDFRPYLTANGSLRWETRTGAPITSGLTELSVTAKKSPVKGLHVVRDGSRQLSGVFYGGNGSEEDMITAPAGGIAGPRIPVRDAFRAAKDVTDVARLQELASADLREHRAPVEQWSFSVRVGEELTPESVQIGRLLRLAVYNDPRIPDGEYMHRVVGTSGDTSMVIGLEVQAA